MTATFTPTGSTLGDYEDLAAYEAETNDHHTPIGVVSNPGLLEVLNGFNKAIREPLAALRGFVRETMAVDPSRSQSSDPSCGKWEPQRIPLVLSDHMPTCIVTLLVLGLTTDDTPASEIGRVHSSPVSGVDNVVEVIEETSRRIALPLKDVLAAAGVKKSTYHSWKAGGVMTPQLASQGRLWELVQFVEDFTEVHDFPIQQWLLTDEARQQLFMSGHFAELREMLLSQPRSLVGAPEYARLAAIGGEIVIDDHDTEPGRHRRGRASRVQTIEAADQGQS